MWWICSCSDLSNTGSCLRSMTQGPARSTSTLGGFCSACAWFSESKVNQGSPEVPVHCYTLAAGPHGGGTVKIKRSQQGLM